MIETNMGKRTLASILVAFMVLTVVFLILDGGDRTAAASQVAAVGPAAALSQAAASQNGISVSASINKRTLRAGEIAVLSVTVEGTSDCDAPEMPSVKDLDIRYSGPSTQVYISGGEVRQSISFRYTVRPSTPGTYSIPPIDVKVGRQTYSTDPIEIEALSATQDQTGVDSQTDPYGLPVDALRLEVRPEKTTVYPGEEIQVRVILYITDVRLTEVTYPRLEGQGFLCSEFSQPVQGRRDLEGRTYQTLEFEAVISPVITGRLSLGPVSMDCEVSLPAQSSRSLFEEFLARDFSGFDSFFDSPILGTQRKTVSVTSHPVELLSKPFPEEGRPASFKGAVGSFTISAHATPTNVKAGDPVSLKIEVCGRGSMRSVSSPIIQELEGMKTYEPTVLSTTSSQKVFEQVIVVRDPAISEIPPVELAYFDPLTEQYRIASSPPIPITVTGSVQAGTSPTEAQSQRSSGPAAQGSAQSEDGLLYIKRSPGTLVPVDELSRPTLAAMLAVAASSLALAVVIPLSFLQGRLDMRNSLRRQTKLHRDAQMTISRLSSVAASSSAYEVIGEARKVVISCLEQTQHRAATERMTGIESRAATAARAATNTVSLPNASGDESLPSVDDILQRLDQLRYSPVAPSADEMRAVLALCSQAIDRLFAESEVSSGKRPPQAGDRPPQSSEQSPRPSERPPRSGKRPPRPGGLISVLLVAALAALVFSDCQVCIASADELALECFYSGNAYYQSGEYDLAIAAYEEAIERGSVNGNLLYNLGNAYAKAGRYGEAMLSYVRASELIPRDRELLHNIETLSSILGLADQPAPNRSAAGRSATDGPAAYGPLAGGQSGLLPRITRTFTQSEWFRSAVVAYVIFSLMIVLRVLPRSRIRPPLVAILVMGCLLVAATSGAFYRRSLFLNDPRAVVIAEEAPVRFEPAPSAPVRYRVSEGQVLSAVDESNPGFLMVKNSAGQTGWIERSVVSPVKLRDSQQSR